MKWNGMEWKERRENCHQYHFEVHFYCQFPLFYLINDNDCMCASSSSTPTWPHSHKWLADTFENGCFSLTACREHTHTRSAPKCVKFTEKMGEVSVRVMLSGGHSCQEWRLYALCAMVFVYAVRWWHFFALKKTANLFISPKDFFSFNNFIRIRIHKVEVNAQTNGYGTRNGVTFIIRKKTDIIIWAPLLINHYQI